MPRRASARTLTSTSSTPHPTSPAVPSFILSQSSNVVQLRQQWKWAAFSQFFFTFEPLFAMNDVTLMDIEDDLTCSTNIFIPRVMQRLLYTLTQDRKISLDNWQTALRKQYLKRDPEASPFGPEPPSWFPVSQPAPSSHLSVEPPTEEVRTGDGVSRSTSPTSFVLPVGEDGVDEGADRPSPQVHERDNQHPDDHVPEMDSKGYKDWLDLPMFTKLDSLHALVEWQFHNPQRLRTIMKDDDEGAEWRIEPIGYDAKGNAYWLIGADRLWIQRVPPKPVNLKRKRTATGAMSNGGVKVQPRPKGRSTKRQCLQPEHLAQTFDGPSTRNTIQLPQPGSSSRGGRAAKQQANMKLDAQAKDLAEYRRQAVGMGTSRTGMKLRTQVSRRPVGTRVSARLRADIADEEWQPVPEEWLMGEGTIGENPPEGCASQASGLGVKTQIKTGLESDEESISDLTELSDDSDEKGDEVKLDNLEGMTSQHKIVADSGLEEHSSLPEGFVEWETICVTLHEWEHIADRFENATHYAEKALRKALVHTIVPVVTDELRQVVRKRRLEEAVVHRKRSSRIAIKESEKEEARTAARKRAEEAEKMSRARRLEMRLQKEEADRERREAIREERRKEREAKELLEKQESNESTDIHVDIVENGHQNNNPQDTVQFKGVVNGSGSGSRTPVGDDWELDCEICQRRGVNQDDGTPMMSCGVCLKWQHINCHDRADTQAGHQKRNWDVDEFVCRRCRSRKSTTGGAYQHPQMDRNDSHLSTQSPHSGFYATSHAPYVSQRINSSPPRLSDNFSGARAYSATINDGQYGQERFSHNSRPSVNTDRTTQSQLYQAHASVAFTHYQPDQRGFSARRPYDSEQTQTYDQMSSYPPSSSLHRAQYPDAAVGSHSPVVYHPTHDYHLPSGNRVKWNAPPTSQTHSYATYNAAADVSAMVPGHSQERKNNFTEPQWQPPLLADRPQYPVMTYQSMGSPLFHAMPR